MASRNRAFIENRIVRKIVSAALKNGWSVSVFDGEEFAIKKSTNFDATIEATMSTDSDTLNFYSADKRYLGSVYLVYGNGYDVIADSSYGHVDEMLEPIVAWIDEHTN